MTNRQLASLYPLPDPTAGGEGRATQGRHLTKPRRPLEMPDLADWLGSQAGLGAYLRLSAIFALLVGSAVAALAAVTARSSSAKPSASVGLH